MLKVNLLPPYIHMRKKLRAAIIFVVVLLIAEVGGLIYAETGPAAEFVRLEQDLQTKTAQLTAVQKVKSDTDKVVAEEGGFRPKYDFIKGTEDYNKIRPSLYDRTQRYIYRDVMLLDLAAEANSMQFSAYVSDPVDVSRLMLGLTRSPDFNGLPQVTGVPGFGQQEKQRREQEGGSVPESSIIGSENSRPTSMGSGAPGGAGGMMARPGMGGPSMMGGGMGGSVMGGPSMGGPGMMPGGMGGPGGGPGMMMGPGMGGSAMGGMGMGGSGGSGSIDKLNIANAVQKPRGFTVQVKAELKNTITRPSYMSSDSQAGKGGGGGGMGMGGMMGMMGGGMGGSVGGGMSPGGMGGSMSMMPKK